MNALKTLLNQKPCFKLICGANNENYTQITNLVALYSALGCKFFDINASKEAIAAAKLGLSYTNSKDCFICISIGADDDPHLSKCKINQTLCTKCNKCIDICPQSAIEQESGIITTNDKRCIGCKLCSKICPNKAIENYQKKIQIETLLPQIKDECDCIELHIVSNNLCEVDKKWKYLCENYSGFLSISVNCSLFSRKDLILQLQKMISYTDKKRVIIQADGSPMTGFDNDYRTTLQAIATADIIEKADLGTAIIVSGGVNARTNELLEQFNININGIAMGSYARKIVKNYINDADFLDNKKKFNEALKVAKDSLNSI